MRQTICRLGIIAGLATAALSSTACKESDKDAGGLSVQVPKYPAEDVSKLSIEITLTPEACLQVPESDELPPPILEVGGEEAQDNAAEDEAAATKAPAECEGIIEKTMAYAEKFDLKDIPVGKYLLEIVVIKLDESGDASKDMILGAGAVDVEIKGAKTASILVDLEAPVVEGEEDAGSEEEGDVGAESEEDAGAESEEES